MAGRVKVVGPPAAGLTGGEPTLTPRVDFRDEDFRRLIDAQGTRLAWARAVRCPCAPINRETGQSDPLCPRCKNHPGWTFFGPDAYAPGLAVGELDSVQKAIVEHYGASVIRGVPMGLGQKDEQNGVIGPWRFGRGIFTVRPENILAFNDRLVDLDSEMVHTEIIEVKRVSGVNAIPLPLTTKFTVIALNYALDQDGKQLRLGVELTLSERGVLSWRPGHVPNTSTRVGVNYLCHSHWRIVSHPKAFRRTQSLLRNPHPTTPLGTPTALAIQGEVMLEYLTQEP